jgi:bifunctional DNA-binding transcriptional regulator/antitoxin component of YhaV-PrlF toxin-antitoxin module
MHKDGEVTIPQKYREYLELKGGDLVQITVTKVGESHGTRNGF